MAKKITKKVYALKAKMYDSKARSTMTSIQIETLNMKPNKSKIKKLQKTYTKHLDNAAKYRSLSK